MKLVDLQTTDTSLALILSIFTMHGHVGSNVLFALWSPCLVCTLHCLWLWSTSEENLVATKLFQVQPLTTMQAILQNHNSEETNVLSLINFH